MTPMQIFEGARSNVERGGRGEHRLTDLAQAVRQHEDSTRGQVAQSARPQDRRLYKRLRQIFGEAIVPSDNERKGRDGRAEQFARTASHALRRSRAVGMD